MSKTFTPLRYPGGKTQFYDIILRIFNTNNVIMPIYIEPFAGGAGLAMKLLLENKIAGLVINDNDIAVYSFWKTLLDYKDWFVEKLLHTEVNIQEWYIQKEIYSKSKTFSKELGFAFFFLNRTNRSGILSAGPIGGYNQSGNFLIDCRFNKKSLLKTIDLIYAHRDQIRIFNYNATTLIRKFSKIENAFWFIDPPYYVKGSELYKNYYKHSNHLYLSKIIKTHLINNRWVLTYDLCNPIKRMYSCYECKLIPLKYSVQTKREQIEIMFYNNLLM